MVRARLVVTLPWLQAAYGTLGPRAAMVCNGGSHSLTGRRFALDCVKPHAGHVDHAAASRCHSSWRRAVALSAQLRAHVVHGGAIIATHERACVRAAPSACTVIGCAHLPLAHEDAATTRREKGCSRALHA